MKGGVMPEFVTLTATKRPISSDGVQWLDYHAVSKRGTNGIDWAVVQFVDNTLYGGSRLYRATNKSGDTYLDAPLGESVTAFVVDLVGGSYVGQPPISNTISITT